MLPREDEIRKEIKQEKKLKGFNNIFSFPCLFQKRYQ